MATSDREQLYLELALAIAQYFYYGGDNDPIMPDHVYDALERRFEAAGGELWVGNASQIERLLALPKVARPATQGGAA